MTTYPGGTVPPLLMVAALVSACATPGPAASPAVPDGGRPAREVAVLAADAPDVRLPPGTNVNSIPLEPPIPVVKGTKAIQQANRAAMQEVRSDRFRGAKLVFLVEEGGRYPIRVPRDGRTLVRFLPDEEFIDLVPPDNQVIFQVGDSYAGEGESLSDTLVIKCHGDTVRPGVVARDQIIYVTTRREYILDLACQQTGNILVGFEHPVSGERSDMGAGGDAPNPAARRSPRIRTISAGAPLENLDCRYEASGRIMALRGDQLSVCTDGRQTIVTFPTEAQAGGKVPMPALFNDPQPNYVAHANPVTGARSWIADKPLADAELRYGAEAIHIRRRAG